MGYPYLVLVAQRFLLRIFGKLRYELYFRRLQISLSLAGLLGTAWLAYASVNVMVSKQIMAGMAEESLRQRLAYSELLDDLSEYHEQLTRLTSDLEANQAVLLSELGREGRNAADLTEVEQQLRVPDSERARVEVARANLYRRLHGLKAELSEVDFANPDLAARTEVLLAELAPEEGDDADLRQAKRHLGLELDRARSELAEARRAEEELQSRLARLRLEVGSAEMTGRELAVAKAQLSAEIEEHRQRLGRARTQQAHFVEQIANLEASLKETAWRAEDFDKDRTILNARIAGLEGRVISMRNSQQAILDRLTERSLLGMGKIEDTIALTGIDVDNLVPALPAGGQEDDKGGPFIPGGYVSEEDTALSLQASIARLDLRLDRWESLHAVAGVLPLTAPLEEMRLTSGFGSRPDPFTGRRASHYGLDLGAQLGTEVLATAPGQVIFAGRRGLFGRFVEIDHGFGIRTRYGHLKKILVKQGQHVSQRDPIGLVGSSGRSTGPHLHYEIRVKGKPLDPMKFVNAG